MAEYLSPGVYIEEIEIGAKPIEGVSTSTAGFLGETERGLTQPKLITSWTQYQRVYGGYFGSDQYLPYAVEGFFKNGGQRCYIARVASSTAVASSLKVDDVDGADALTVTAVGQGVWGDNIYLKIEAEEDTSRFKLTLFYWSTLPTTIYDPDRDKKSLPRPSLVESFSNLSVDETSTDYYGKKVNGMSNLIEIEKETTDSGKIPQPLTITPLTSGTVGATVALSDYKGTNSAGISTGLLAFEKVDDISILYTPNPENIPDLTSALITHCETMKDRFAIIDSKQNLSDIGNLKPRDSYDTKYAAYYYPWIKIINPQNGMKKLIPAGGYMAGIYARSDVERGVHKAPANEVVRGVVDLEFPITKGEQDILNPRGVNCIRAFSGRGIRIWGARTLSSDPLWRYINVRRLFLYMEESIEEGTQWVVFEPNSEILWARVIQTISNFLKGVWKSGALMGTTPEEAFFVKCDRTTMTQDDIDNGRLIVMIGVAPVKPAEFVIFRIAQWTNNAE